MQDLYRNQDGSLQRLHAELRRDRNRELDQVDTALGAVYAARVARSFAGALAFGGMTVVFAAGIVAMVYWTFDLPVGIARLLSLAAAFTWLASLAVFAFARAAARSQFRAVLGQELVPTGDLHAEISRLAAQSGAGIAARVIARWEHRSILWPLMGVSLAAPLLIHYLFASAVGLRLLALHDFGLWVGLSALVVGHCHYFAAHQAVSFASAMRDRAAPSWDEVRTYGWRAVVVAIGTSLMPGLAALGLPCIVVALTALAFLPACYGAVYRAVVRERAAIDAIIG